MALLAPAKINLALHVTGRRKDGYHLIDTIVAFADFGDRVAITPAERLSLRVTGPFATHAPGDERDLAWRAAAAFFAHTGLPSGASIHVEKNIPAGAGLGGGSADAAAVLAGLDRHFEAGIPASDLAKLGLNLGADVPMCLGGRALRATGVGEEIAPLVGWPGLPLVLVWPRRPVSSAEAFEALRSRKNALLTFPPANASLEAIAAFLADCRNDLEAPALGIAPEIGAVLEALRASAGCMVARMSGSGSACFGLYPDAASARRAADAFRLRRPQWWVAAAEAR